MTWSCWSCDQYTIVNRSVRLRVYRMKPTVMRDRRAQTLVPLLCIKGTTLRSWAILAESQAQNLDLTVVYVPIRSTAVPHEQDLWNKEGEAEETQAEEGHEASSP